MQSFMQFPSNSSFYHVLPFKWHKKKCFQRHRVLTAHSPWLLYRGSLTAKLQQNCQRSFSVNLLSQRRQRLHYDEAKKLYLSTHCWATVREVALMCDDKAVVMARTIIPDKTLRGKGRQLKFIGKKAIIDILTKDRQLSRGPFELVRLKTKADFLWARRSLFYFYGQPLLIMEVFLQDQT